MSDSTGWEKYFGNLQAGRLKRIIESADKDEHTLNGVTYRYKKINVRQFMELEELRATLENETDKTKITGHYIAVYKKSADYFLGIGDADFWTIAFEDIKPVIDGCAYRSLHGKPFLST